MITLNSKPINITHFPDHTAQVWKVEGLEDNNPVIEWYYENDSEIFHLMQLLCIVGNEQNKATLFIPFLPYARQDKEVSNEATFAVNPLAWILGSMANAIAQIIVVDVHSKVFEEKFRLVDDYIAHSNSSFRNIYPSSLVSIVNEYDVIIFPDKGALDRYGKLFSVPTQYSMSKVRDQLTGEILGLEFNEKDVDLHNKRVIIVDDICDGGRTFVGVADAVEFSNMQHAELSLCVTHGIFSSMPLLDSMLNRNFANIYTTDSLYMGMDNQDWIDAAKQGIKHKILRQAMLANKLHILDCISGNHLPL